MSRRRLAHDIIDVFGSRIAVAVLGTVTGIVLARTLGPHDRGILALVLLLPSTFVTLSKFGLTQANVYCVRREGASIERVATNSLVLGAGPRRRNRRHLLAISRHPTFHHHARGPRVGAVAGALATAAALDRQFLLRCPAGREQLLAV